MNNCCHCNCCCKKEKEINIPIMYTAFRSNWMGLHEKVKPADYIKLEDVCFDDVVKIKQAIGILARHNIYFFQEKH